MPIVNQLPAPTPRWKPPRPKSVNSISTVAANEGQGIDTYQMAPMMLRLDSKAVLNADLTTYFAKPFACSLFLDVA